MYPPQDNHTPAPHPADDDDDVALRDDDEVVVRDYPVVVASPTDVDPAAPSSFTGNYLEQSYADAYPQPCLPDYPPFPPQLHIHTDLRHRYLHDALQSPYASTSSASASTSYHTPTPPSNGPPSSSYSEHSDHSEYYMDAHMGPSLHLPYHLPQSDPLDPLWDEGQSVAGPSQASYVHPDSQHFADTSQQWVPAYHTDPQPSSSSTGYYHHSFQVHPQAYGGQPMLSNPYPVLSPYPATSPIGGSSLPQGVYGQGAFVSDMRHEGPMGASHAHLGTYLADNEEGTSTGVSRVPPRRPEDIFDSPLRQPVAELSEEPTSAYYHRAPPPSPSPSPPLIPGHQVVPAFLEHPSGGSTDFRAYVPVGTSENQSPSPYFAPDMNPTPPPFLAPAPPGALYPRGEPPFPQTPQRALYTEQASHSPPARETARGPIQPPRLLETEPIGPCGVAGPSSAPPRHSRRRSPSSRRRRGQFNEELPEPPIVPSQSHVAPRRDRSSRGGRQTTQTFRPFHPYPSYQRAGDGMPSMQASNGPATSGRATTSSTGGCMPTPVFGLFGSYPLSRGPCEQPLPGPTCAPASSSSVMRLVLTPATKRPPPPPPPPPVLPPRRPRMACFFCRKRKIACGQGPPPSDRPREEGGGKAEGGKEEEEEEENPPCNQCARRGLDCLRPTESRRGVRRGKCRETDEEEDDTQTPGASSSQVTLELAPRPRLSEPSSYSAEDTIDEEDDIEYVFQGDDAGEDDQAGPSGSH